MDIYDDIANELSGDGMIIIDGFDLRPGTASEKAQAVERDRTRPGERTCRCSSLRRRPQRHPVGKGGESRTDRSTIPQGWGQ